MPEAGRGILCRLINQAGFYPPRNQYRKMDWNNIELPADGKACLVDPFTIDDLLLQVSCNCPEITEAAIMVELQSALNQRMFDAWDVFEANKETLLAAARKDRKS